MGALFSLRSAAEWEEAVSKMAIPSIWSNVSYSPLSRERQVLFDRPGRAQYSFPSGLRQGAELLVVSDVCDMSLITCFDDHAGHFYCALLLSCPHSTSPHKIRRRVDEIVLKPGGNAESGNPKGKPGAAGGGTLPGKAESSQGEGFAPLTMTAVMQDDGEGWQESKFSQLLLYAVKEGVLCFFADEPDECEGVVRAIANTYSRGGGAGTLQAAEFGGGTGAGAQLSSSLRIKTIKHHVGRCAPPVCRVLSDAIVVDLQRTFAIRSEPEEQDGHTNCAAFCMRMLTAVQLSVRGYDIQRVCENSPELGAKAGEAAGSDWERLLRNLG